MKGLWSSTAASTEIVPADEHRDSLLIQKTNDTTVALGIGEAAVAGEGVQLVNKGDTAILNGASARCAIYAIGNEGAGTYQDGEIVVIPSPYIAAG